MRKLTRVNRNCLNCNKEFWIHFYRVKTAKYCGYDCYWKYIKGKNRVLSSELLEKYRKIAKKRILKKADGFGNSKFGFNNSFYGKKHSEETKNKIRNSNYHKDHKLSKHSLWQGGI